LSRPITESRKLIDAGVDIFWVMKDAPHRGIDENQSMIFWFHI